MEAVEANWEIPNVPKTPKAPKAPKQKIGKKTVLCVSILCLTLGMIVQEFLL